MGTLSSAPLFDAKAQVHPFILHWDSATQLRSNVSLVRVYTMTTKYLIQCCVALHYIDLFVSGLVNSLFFSWIETSIFSITYYLSKARRSCVCELSAMVSGQRPLLRCNALLFGIVYILEIYNATSNVSPPFLSRVEESTCLIDGLLFYSVDVSLYVFTFLFESTILKFFFECSHYANSRSIYNSREFSLSNLDKKPDGCRLGTLKKIDSFFLFLYL